MNVVRMLVAVCKDKSIHAQRKTQNKYVDTKVKKEQLLNRDNDEQEAKDSFEASGEDNKFVFFILISKFRKDYYHSLLIALVVIDSTNKTAHL